MTPYEIAQECYGESLPKLLEYYMNLGTVYCDKSIFVMGCTTSTGKLKGVLEPAPVANCWYIHFAAGDLRSLFTRIIPHDLDYVAFERQFRNHKVYRGDHPPAGEIHFLKMERVRKLLTSDRMMQDIPAVAHSQPPLTWEYTKAILSTLVNEGELSQVAKQSLLSRMEQLCNTQSKQQ